MLIRFAVQNWMSFRDLATLSLLASRERQHGQRVARPRKNLGVLPIAAIYGGNASGKSNLFKALAFAKQLIVQGMGIDQVIAVHPLGFVAKQMECTKTIDKLAVAHLSDIQTATGDQHE